MKRISGLLYALKAWVEGFAGKPHAGAWLFLIAFVESSLLPIPPDVLLIALCVANPRSSFRFAAICTAGSAAGALLGYSIGYAFFDTIGTRIVTFYGMSDQFNTVLQKYSENAWVTIILAGFTPIPFSVFTIAAGFNLTISPLTFGLASLVGRSLRFLTVGGLLHVFGPRVKEHLDRHLTQLMLIIGVLVVAAILAVRNLL